MHSTLLEWVAHCTKDIGSIPEGEQKAHKYTCFARSALCTGNYDLYVLVFFVLGVRGDSAHLPLSDILSLTGVDGGGAESLR